MTAPQSPDVELLKRTLLTGIQRDRLVAPSSEARVHHAIDLLACREQSEELRLQVEQISCALRRMQLYLVQGRVNAHASALLRLRRLVEAL